MDGEAIPGTSGTLFTVTLKADVSLTAGTKLTGAVKNIEFNTQDNHKLTFDEVTLSHKSMQKTSALLRADVFEYFMSYYFFSKNRAQNKKKIVPLHTDCINNDDMTTRRERAKPQRPQLNKQLEAIRGRNRRKTKA